VDPQPTRRPSFIAEGPYVGHRGWIGVRLDVDVDWDEIRGIVTDAYRAVAPKKLLAELDG
jgi:predicted DNA-binding protein (MmcQ/YjbR family)